MKAPPPKTFALMRYEDRAELGRLRELESWCIRLIHADLGSKEWNEAMDAVGNMVTDD